MSNNRCVPKAVVKLAVAAAAMGCLAAPASATNWFVDGANGARLNAGTAGAPFQFMWQAMQVVQPGDAVYVLPTKLYYHLSVTVSGTAAKPIRIIGGGAPPLRTKVTGNSDTQAIWIDADYVSVENFDATTTGPDAAILVSENHHHVTIANNIAHNAGANGISTFTDDYITIKNNVVYGNAWNTSTGSFASGISLLGNYDVDNNTGVKMIVDGNIVYANTNTPSCGDAACLANWSDSDGSGIIIDDARRIRFDNIPYRGRTLITNNVVFGNGGRGVHIYKSDHVTVANNTMFSNNQDPYEGLIMPGEVSAVTAGDVQIYNNILYSDGLTGPNLTGSTVNQHVAISVKYCNLNTGPVIASNNLTFNPQNVAAYQAYVDPTTTIPVDISQNIWAGAKFTRASLWPHLADFRVKATSPAMRNANAAMAPAYDIMGKRRVYPATIGAYQNAGP